ncbi:hypothetical protein ACWC4J_05820 [Streptomyces sp. NPDC001356]
MDRSEQVAIERTTFIEASATRAKELAAREERLNKRAESMGNYVMSITRRLDEALTRNSHLEHELADTKAAYEELARDHNTLIREALQERADRFSRRTVTPAPQAAIPCAPARAPQDDHPVRPYADPDGGHHPVAPIPLRHIPAPAARLADTPPQHERPAEGVRVRRNPHKPAVGPRL